MQLHSLLLEQHQAVSQLLRDGKPSSNQAVSSYLAEALELPEHPHDARSSILLDFAAWMCTLCHKLQLDATQAMAVLHIGQQLLAGCTMGVSRSQAQDLLKSSLLQLCSATSAQHTAPPPPAASPSSSSAAVAAVASAPESQATPGSEASAVPPASDPVHLPPDVVANLAASFTGTMLQHYSLWSHVFTREQQHVQHQHHLMVESPVAPPPLQQALIESEHLAYLASEQAQQEAAAAEAAAAEAAAREEEAAAEAAAAEAAEAAARAEYLQRKPKTLDEAVDKLVAVKLDELRQGLAADYAAKATALSGRIGQLEQQQQRAQQAAAAAATASQSNSHSGARVASAKAAPGSRVASAKPAAS